MKDVVNLISWDECGGTAEHTYVDQEDNELILPITCSDDELVAFLRQQNGDDLDDDGEWGTDWKGRPNRYGWRCANVTRSENAALVEWRSDRNHLAITTVIWI